MVYGWVLDFGVVVVCGKVLQSKQTQWAELVIIMSFQSEIICLLRKSQNLYFAYRQALDYGESFFHILNEMWNAQSIPTNYKF